MNGRFYLLTRDKNTSGWFLCKKRKGIWMQEEMARNGEKFERKRGGRGNKENKRVCFEVDSSTGSLCKASDDTHDGSTCPQGQEAERLDPLGLLPDLAVQVEFNGQQVHITHVEQDSR